MRIGFAFLLLLLPRLAAAQQAAVTGTIRLQVLSAGQPVKGARVAAGQVTAVTDESGTATLVIAAGTVEVAVAAQGFLPGRAAFTVVAGESQQVELELQPSPDLNEEITVSATRAEMRLEEVPIRVEVLDQEEIEEKVMMTPGDIVMMLNEMGGMRVQATSPSLGAASVRIQGMKGRYTRFLADGLPLFGQQVGGLGLLQIPPVDLGQVEVIKGVASALYGSGAMGGVVNLISRRPGDKPAYEFLLNQSTRGATDFVPFLSGPLSTHWKATLLGGAHHQTLNDVDHDGWADLAGYTRGLVRPRLFWDSGNGKTAFLTGSITAESRRGGTVPGRVLAQTGRPYAEALETRRYDLGGDAQFTFHGKYIASLRGAFALQNHDHQFGDIREVDRHTSVFGEASVHSTAGPHTWVAGAGIDVDSYNPRDVPRFAYRYVTPSLFAQDDLVIRPWLTVSASGRVDFHNRYGTFFSPRLSALFRSKRWTSRISAGTGFFAPTALTEETEAAGLTRLQIARPLKAELGRSASFDLTRTAGPASFTVTLFGSRVRNQIHVERDTRYELVNLPRTSYNAGLEFVATWRHNPFSVTTTYSYVYSREATLAGGREDSPLTPRHSVGLIGMWEKEDVFRVGVECYYTGWQALEVNPFRSGSEPYVLLGGLVERRFGHFRLFVNAENLGNVKQTIWDPLLRPSRGADGRWTVDAWAPLDGRVINGGVRLLF